MQSSAPWFLVPAIVLAFVVMFASMWTGVCALIALASGWRSMAARYPCPEGFSGAPLSSGFAIRVGISSYRGVMSFEAAPQGLIVRVSRLFPFHRALLLPWGAIALTRGGGVFFAGTMRVYEGADFSLNGDAYASIERAMGGGSGPTAMV